MKSRGALAFSGWGSCRRPRFQASQLAFLWLGAALAGSTKPATARAQQPLPRAEVQALAPAETPPPPTLVELEPFFSALQELAAGRRSSSVRILWLGDSHTNADFMTGTVRSALGDRFGDGGPGFVRVGVRAYRHDGLKLVQAGGWNVDPDPPARRSPQDDGVFGLGGVRAVPAAAALFAVEFTSPVALSSLTSAANARFELGYTLPTGSRFIIELDGRSLEVNERTPSERAASGISHLQLRAPLASRLRIAWLRGTPRFFQLIIERERPGVVLDAVGIDGARLATPLAWDGAAFAAEVARRDPQLFVIAFGTNEAFDRQRTLDYGAQLGQLVARLRSGAPGAACLVLGPPDAAEGPGSVPRVAEINQVEERTARELGCAFVSLQTLMGGEGSFWRGQHARERRAQADRIHLTPKGYRELGASLAHLLVSRYGARAARAP